MEPAGSLVLLVPGRLETSSGGYGYDRRIVEGLGRRGWSVSVRALDSSFPRPSPGAHEHAAGELAAIPEGSRVLLDGLALGAMPDEVEREKRRLKLIALVHHPLAAETGLDRDTAAALEETERRALSTVRLVVVTSQATADTLGRRYGVGRDRIAIVEPGTDAAEHARGSSDGSLHLVCVAAVIPRKGHAVLARALATIPDERWRLTCVGSTERDSRTVEQLRGILRASGLQDRVLLAGEADETRLAAWYDVADVFVLPTLYEGYGMAVAEALARGLPVVSTATGAIPDLLSDGAGLVVPPGDPDALAGALRQILDPEVRARLTQGALRARRRLPTWEEATDRMEVALNRVCRGDEPR